ncbi:Cdc6/Cdc18 family protein, partial [Halolamina salina]
DAEELQEVLNQRVTVSFYEDAIADGVIELCAAYGAKDGGDARKALDLLRAAADHARAKDATIVDEDNVAEARRELEREEVMDGIADLADQHKLSLYALVSLQHNQDDPSRSKDIYERYQELCDISHHDARTLRRVRDFLGEIEGLGVIESIQRNQGYPEGKYNAYELGHDEEMILAAMSDLLNEVGIHEDVADVVEKSDRISA